MVPPLSFTSFVLMLWLKDEGFAWRLQLEVNCDDLNSSTTCQCCRDYSSWIITAHLLGSLAHCSVFPSPLQVSNLLVLSVWIQMCNDLTAASNKWHVEGNSWKWSRIALLAGKVGVRKKDFHCKYAVVNIYSWLNFFFDILQHTHEWKLHT